jgi:LPS sulfotransferase NodH
MSDLQSIIFCATLRSGSTYFCRMVANEFEIGNPREWFEGLNVEERLREYDLNPDTRLEDYAKRVVEEESSSTGIFSVKLMFKTFSRVMKKLAAEDRGKPGRSKAELFRQYFPDPKFIFITRKDKVRQAISYARALQARVWEIPSEENRSDVPLLNFDFLNINWAVEDFNHEEKEWNEIFRELECTPFVAVYEDLIENPGHVLAEIGRYLGLEAVNKPKELASLPLVMSDRTNDEWELLYGKILLRTKRRASETEDLALPGTAFRATLTPLLHERSGIAGSRVKFPVIVRNESELVWDPIGLSDGSYWIRLRARWADRSSPDVPVDDRGTHLIEPVQPGEEVSIGLILAIPEKAGLYDLAIDLTQEGVTWFGDAGSQPLKLEFEVVPDLQKSAAECYFSEAKPLEAGWKWLACLGYYYDAYFPWIYHREFGWLYCDGEGSGSDSCYFWRCADSVWLWYQYGSVSPRRFHNFASASWEEY